MSMRAPASLIVLALACSPDESGPAAGTGGVEAESDGGGRSGASGASSGGAGGRAGDAGRSSGGALLRDAAADAVTGCTDDPELAPEGAVCIETVSGRLIDEDGQPIAADVLVSACGPQQCNPGHTDAQGDFVIPVGLHLPPEDYSVLGHTRPEHAGFYFRLPPESTGPAIDMGDLRLIRMDVDGDRLEVDREGAAAQSVTSGEVTLDVPDGVYVRLDVESNLAGDQGKQFRAVRIAASLQDEYVDPAEGIVALYALEPFEAQFETPAPEREPTRARLSFENTEGLPAGSGVEVVALGTYLYADWLTPAVFEPVATAKVTSDGERIELDPGQGVQYLTWIGVRPIAD